MENLTIQRYLEGCYASLEHDALVNIDGPALAAVVNAGGFRALLRDYFFCGPYPSHAKHRAACDVLELIVADGVTD